VKGALFLLNVVFTMTILDLIQVYCLASLVIVLSL